MSQSWTLGGNSGPLQIIIENCDLLQRFNVRTLNAICNSQKHIRIISLHTHINKLFAYLTRYSKDPLRINVGVKFTSLIVMISLVSYNK